MKSFKKSLAVMLLAFGLVFLTAVPQAFAVATLEVTITDGQNALPGETISLFSETGTEVEQDDKKGGVWYFNDLEPGTYTIKSGDKVVRTVTISPEDTIKRIAVTAPAFISMPNWPNWSLSNMNMALGLRGIAKRGSFDTDIHYNANNPMGDFGVSGFGAGFDLMVRPPNLAEVFFMASFGWLGSLDDQAAHDDFHPAANVDDSYVELEEDNYLRFLLGWTFWRQQQLEFDALAGIQGTDRTFSLVTDESGGGGIVNRFEDSERTWGPVFGLQLRHQTNLFAGNGRRGAQLYGTMTGAYMSDADISGTSTLGNQYSARLDSDWQGEASFGIMFPF